MHGTLFQVHLIRTNSYMTTKKYHKILIRSSWQSVNIGDIGHTPGLLAILEQVRPDLELTLWPCEIGHGVKEMLQREFPNVRLVEGASDSVAVQQAFAEHDFMLHGSGPSVVCATELQAWRQGTGKPYGIFGVTVARLDLELKELLDHAEFIYCRDTVSMALLRNSRVKCPIIEFGPDATFAINLHDGKTAENFLNQHGLEKDKFVCVIPRLRYTPYHKIHHTEPTAEDLRRVAVSDEFMEVDHQKLREAMMAILENSTMKILICAEMTYEVELGKTMLYDRLPEKYLSRVIWRDSYWRPDEAASVYVAANSMVSFEMHSPIIALAEGTPAIYLRQPTDTCKGQMWRDIGLSEWIFEIESTTGSEISQQILAIIDNPQLAKGQALKALKYARKLQTDALSTNL